MKQFVLAFAAIAMIAAFVLAAAEAPGYAVWTLAESKAAEAKFAADPKDPTANPVISNVDLPSGDIARRTSFGKTGEAEVHDNNSDVFCVLSGEGEFVLGGKVVNAKITNPGETRGTAIQGGVTRKVGAGDIVIVPPKTPHQIILAKGRRMTFLVTKMYK